MKFGNYETLKEEGTTTSVYVNGLEVLNHSRYQSSSINIQNTGAESMFYKVLLYKHHDSVYPEIWVPESSISAGVLDTVDLIEKPCAKVEVQVKNDSGVTTFEISATMRGTNA